MVSEDKDAQETIVCRQSSGEPRREGRLSRALCEQSGAVFAEYVTLLVLVSVGCAAATIALGIPLNNLYIFQRAFLLLPVP